MMRKEDAADKMSGHWRGLLGLRPASEEIQQFTPSLYRFSFKADTSRFRRSLHGNSYFAYIAFGRTRIFLVVDGFGSYFSPTGKLKRLSRVPDKNEAEWGRISESFRLKVNWAAEYSGQRKFCKVSIDVVCDCSKSFDASTEVEERRSHPVPGPEPSQK